MSDSTRGRTLERKLRGMFPDLTTRAVVRDALARYATVPNQRERVRVQRAVLTLCAGTCSGVDKYVRAAKADDRDVLRWAEYPNQGRSRRAPDDPGGRILIEEDAAQYRAWLRE